MAPSTRIVMLGTGDFALPTFVHLCATGHHVERLITQPERPQGRKQELIPSAIKQAAIARGIPVDQPEDVNAPDSVQRLRALAPDLLVTAAYGQILSAEILGVPQLGGINLHGSILPAYRGAAPVARAIERGEHESGVTVILMTPQIDAGGMIAVDRTPIDPDETAGALEARLAALGAPLVAAAIAALAAGTARMLPQEKARVTRAPKLRKEDGLINWSKPARAVHDQVRAMQPWPVAYTYWHRREPAHPGLSRLLIHATTPLEGQGGAPGTVLEAHGDLLVIAAGAGAVRVLTLQREGKKPGPVGEFLRGNHVAPGDVLGSAP
jgi:methionyl-tRNA formyltransferase